MESLIPLCNFQLKKGEESGRFTLRFIQELTAMANFFNVLRRGVLIFLLILSLDPQDISAAIPDGIEKRSISQFFSGISFTVEVNKPFTNSSMNAFPNGRDMVQVTLETVRSDGTFAENLPIKIEKPNNIMVSGPTNTENGSIQLFFSINKSGSATIVIKLADFPRVKTSFNLNFVPRTSIQNRTDTNSFLIKQPVTSIVQIDPVEARGLKEAKLRYVSIGNFFKVKTKKQEVIKDLKCSTDGICSATIPASETNLVLLRRRSFNYQFSFVDQQNDKFSKSYSGTLKLP